MLAADQLLVDRDSAAHRHPELRQLRFLIAYEIAEFGARRDAGGDPHLAADVRRSLVDGDLVAVLGGADGGLQAGGTGSHYEDLAGTRLGRLEGDGFASGAGIFDAAEPAVQSHPADALLIARQAQAYVLGVART